MWLPVWWISFSSASEMVRLKPLALICWLALLCGWMGGARAEVVIVVAAGCPVNHLTSEQVAKIYLGKMTVFPGGGEAIPLDQKDDSPARSEFYRKVVKKSPAQLSAYWARLIFAGDGQPPQQMEGDLAIRKAVAGSVKAIGYIERNEVDRSVKIILVP